MTSYGDSLADRIALRDLVDAYALEADRADGKAVAALFVANGWMTLWLDPTRDEPTSHRFGRREIAAAIESLGRYHATHHVVSSARATVRGDRARGVAMCVAHHLEGEPSDLRDRVMYIHYKDTFIRNDGQWWFECRDLRVQWVNVAAVAT